MDLVKKRHRLCPRLQIEDHLMVRVEFLQSGIVLLTKNFCTLYWVKLIGMHLHSLAKWWQAMVEHCRLQQPFDNSNFLLSE